MKAYLSFNLPEETEQHEMAINGIKYLCVLQELDNYLRALSKYEDKEVIEIDTVREKISELMHEENISLY